MGTHDRLLDELAGCWKGKEPSRFYRGHLSPNHNYARIGRNGSRNIAWMANAIGCHQGDLDCVQWVHDAAFRENNARDVDATHKYRFDCFKLSPIYQAWNWCAEASAMWFVRNMIDQHGHSDELDGANVALTVLLCKRATLWGLMSIPDIEGRRGDGKIFWKGPGCYPAGLRGKEMRFHDGNQLGVQALGEEPVVDRISKRSSVAYIANALPDLALSRGLKSAINAFIHDNWHELDVNQVLPYIRNTRTAVPVTINSYRDGHREVLLTSHIEGGNTGALWGTTLMGPDSRETCYPYTSQRVRSGHPELGMGKAAAHPGSFTAWNLNPHEEHERRRPALRDRLETYRANGIPDISVRLDPDLEGRVYLKGRKQ